VTRVSIVITAHNYAKFLAQAVDSALAQTHPDVEVVIVNDGSTDHTEEVLALYQGRPNIKIVRLDGVGLAAASNRGIEAASADYIVRLDADDWFDENLALVLASYLDRNPKNGMVFCDYYTVDVHGEIIDSTRRSLINDEVKLLDRPCLAAGAMYRRQCWQTIGGYNETLRYQEDYDFWIKFIERYTVRNVSLPLMYYRQHGNNMSRNWGARMEARRQVKERFVRENRDRFNQTVLAVVPARGDQLNQRKLPLLPLGSCTLLERGISTLRSVDLIDRIVVSTDDPQVAEAAEAAGAEVPFLRSRQLSSPSVPFETVVADLLAKLADGGGYRPDILVIFHPHSPFITGAHVAEAIDTLLLYRADSVIGVVEDLTYHWRPAADGLSPVGYQKRVIRQEKDIIFKEAGGLYVVQAKRFGETNDLLGRHVGHIEMAVHEAVRIQSPYDYWLALRMNEQAGQWATI
jgi:CMP-N-acetylneuraminic acid synthetase